MKLSQVLKGASLLGISSLLSRLLGVVRDHLLAYNFGASSGEGIFDLDVYYAAFRLPDLIYNIVIFGTVSAVFIPIFAEMIEHKEKNKAWEFVSIILNLAMTVLLVICLVIFVFAPLIVPVFVPGFSPEKLQLTILLTRILLISPLFFGVSSLAQSVSNVFHSFVFYALAPIFYNLSIIASIFFADEYGVFALVIGVIVGAFLHMLVQLPQIFRFGFRYRWLWDTTRGEVRELVRILPPRLLAGAIIPLFLVVDTFVASFLPTGSVSIVNYAFNLQSLPMGVVGLSFAIVSFGLLSKLAARGDWNEFEMRLKQVINNILRLIIPAAAGLYLLRFEITRLILGNGKFTDMDVTLTAQMLGIFCFGVIFQSILPLLMRVFYSLKNTLVPLVIGLFGLLITLVVSYIGALHFGLGVYGIALGNVMAVIFQFMASAIMLKSYLTRINRLFFNRALVGFLFATLMMIVAVFFLKMQLVSYNSGYALLFKTAILSAMGAGAYFGCLWIYERHIWR